MNLHPHKHYHYPTLVQTQHLEHCHQQLAHLRFWIMFILILHQILLPLSLNIFLNFILFILIRSSMAPLASAIIVSVKPKSRKIFSSSFFLFHLIILPIQCSWVIVGYNNILLLPFTSLSHWLAFHHFSILFFCWIR